MATVVNVSKGVKEANKLISNVEMIYNGVNGLVGMFPRMAEVLGAGGAEGQAALCAAFGFGDETQAQAFFDRLNAFQAAWEDGTNVEFAKIRDLVVPFVS